VNSGSSALRSDVRGCKSSPHFLTNKTESHSRQVSKIFEQKGCLHRLRLGKVGPVVFDVSEEVLEDQILY